MFSVFLAFHNVTTLPTRKINNTYNEKALSLIAVLKARLDVHTQGSLVATKQTQRLAILLQKLRVGVFVGGAGQRECHYPISSWTNMEAS